MTSKKISFEKAMVLVGNAMQKVAPDMTYTELKAFMFGLKSTISLAALNGLDSRRDRFYYLLKIDAHDENARLPELNRYDLLNQLAASCGLGKAVCDAGLTALDKEISSFLDERTYAYLTIEKLGRFTKEGVDRYHVVLKDVMVRGRKA